MPPPGEHVDLLIADSKFLITLLHHSGVVIAGAGVGDGCGPRAAPAGATRLPAVGGGRHNLKWVSCVCLFVSFPRISVRFLCVQCISALCDVYVRLFCCLHCVCVLCVRAYHSPVYACVCLFPRVSGVSSFWRTVHVLRFVTCMCVLCVCVRIIRLCVHRLSG